MNQPDQSSLQPEPYRFQRINMGLFLFGLVFSILQIFICNSCIFNRIGQGSPGKSAPAIRLQAGVNHGGIVENTNMGVVNNAPADAFSGATNPGFNTGVHLNLPLKHNSVETGIDWLVNNQTFTYKDAVHEYYGDRKISLNQLRVPITYNFSLLKNRFPEAQIQLKIGYSAGLNFLKVDDNNASLPVYSCTRFSHGLTLGFSGLPFTLGTSSKLGFHFDLYRGTQVYKDFYNEARKECGSSYARVGVVYQFNAGK